MPFRTNNVQTPSHVKRAPTTSRTPGLQGQGQPQPGEGWERCPAALEPRSSPTDCSHNGSDLHGQEEAADALKSPRRLLPARYRRSGLCLGSRRRYSFVLRTNPRLAACEKNNRFENDFAHLLTPLLHPGYRIPMSSRCCIY